MRAPTGLRSCVRVHDCKSKISAQMCASKRRCCVRTHAYMPMQARTLAHACTRTANTRTSRVLLALPRAAGLHTHINKCARAHTQTDRQTDTQANRFALTLEEEMRVMRQVTTHARALLCAALRANIHTHATCKACKACARLSECRHACAYMSVDAKPFFRYNIKPSLTTECSVYPSVRV